MSQYDVFNDADVDLDTVETILRGVVHAKTSDLISRNAVLTMTGTIATHGAKFEVIFPDEVKQLPAVDAVQVVRCENCRHSCPVTYSKLHRWCYLGRKVVCGEDYCSDGESKT